VGRRVHRRPAPDLRSARSLERADAPSSVERDLALLGCERPQGGAHGGPDRNAAGDEDLLQRGVERDRAEERPSRLARALARPRSRGTPSRGPKPHPRHHARAPRAPAAPSRRTGRAPRARRAGPRSRGCRTPSAPRGSARSRADVRSRERGWSSPIDRRTRRRRTAADRMPRRTPAGVRAARARPGGSTAGRSPPRHRPRPPSRASPARPCPTSTGPPRGSPPGTPPGGPGRTVRPPAVVRAPRAGSPRRSCRRPGRRRCPLGRGSA